MFKNLLKQLKKQETENSFCPATCPLETGTKRMLLNSLSNQALRLYEKKSDINKFKKLALSDPENDDYKYLIDKLFDLSENEKFLRDLGL